MDGLEYFLTYADNNAVGYFSKQSFTKNVTLEKDKVGAKLMWRGCLILGHRGQDPTLCSSSPRGFLFQNPPALKLLLRGTLTCAAADGSCVLLTRLGALPCNGCPMVDACKAQSVFSLSCMDSHAICIARSWLTSLPAVVWLHQGL